MCLHEPSQSWRSFFFQEYDGVCGGNPDNVHAANVGGQQSHCFYLIRAERSWLESVGSSFWMENWSFCVLFFLGGVARPYPNVCYKKVNMPPPRIGSKQFQISSCQREEGLMLLNAVGHKLVTWNSMAHTLAHTNEHTLKDHKHLWLIFSDTKQKNNKQKKFQQDCWLSCTILWHLISAMHLYKITVVYNILYFKCCIYWLREEETSFSLYKNKLRSCDCSCAVNRIDQRNRQENRSGTTTPVIVSNVQLAFC